MPAPQLPKSSSPLKTPAQRLGIRRKRENSSLGPWKPHLEATASNSYATGFAAFVLQRSGVASSTPSIGRALDWLKSHQDRKSGNWPGDSMNKQPFRFNEKTIHAGCRYRVCYAGVA